MEYKLIAGIVATILIFVAYIPYTLDTIKGKTRPHVFSFFLWSLLSYIVFAMQLQSGGGAGSWLTFLVGLIVTILFVLGLKNGRRDIRSVDYIFLILTLLAIPLWLVAEQPVLSIILLSVIDMMAFVPTIRKSWVDPWSETLSMYLISGFRHALAIVALAEINIVTSLFLVVWTAANFLFVGMLIFRRQKLERQDKRILITGVSGTGKSTIAAKLAEQGYTTVDIDKAEGLCNWFNRETGDIVDYQAELNAEFVKNHTWLCDREKLEQLIAGNETVLVFGMADNFDELEDLFDQTILLKCSPEIFLNRIMHREDNDFGKHPEIQKLLEETHQEFEDKMIAKGAVPVDVSKPVIEIVEKIKSLV